MHGRHIRLKASSTAARFARFSGEDGENVDHGDVLERIGGGARADSATRFDKYHKSPKAKRLTFAWTQLLSQREFRYDYLLGRERILRLKIISRGKMGLSTQEQILIEQRVTNEAKSVGAAYFCFGSFSALWCASILSRQDRRRRGAVDSVRTGLDHNVCSASVLSS